MTRRLLITALLMAAPRAAFACPVCFGQNDSPLASAINLGIIVMLVVVAGVLGAFALFIVNLNRRARLAARAEQADGPRRPGTYGSADPQEGIAQC